MKAKKSYTRTFHLDPPHGPVVSRREEGDPQSKILILGEAPSSHELRLGRPLVGESGQIFNALLHQSGLIRRQVYILNVFRNRVGKSIKGDTIYVEGRPDLILWTKKHGFTDRALTDTTSAIAKIRASGANVIVCLGGTAISLLCSSVKSITKWRGSILQPDASTGLKRKVIPTYHPAATVFGRGKYIWRYDIAADFKKAKAQSESRAYKLDPMELIIRPSFSEAMDFIKYCKEQKIANTDLEIYGRNVSCFSLAADEKTAISIPLVDEYGKAFYPEEDEIEIWKAYSDLMHDESVMKMNQNILFDAWVLLFINRILMRGTLHDCMIMQAILYPDFPKRLEYITSLYTDMTYYKDDKKLWKNFWRDIEAFWLYNAKDSIASIRCTNRLWEDIVEKGYEQQYNDYMDDLPSLLYMMTQGVAVDGKALEETRLKIEKMLKKKMEEFLSVAEYEFNPTSPKQCIQYFYVHKNIRAYINVKTKRPTIDDLALARIIRRYNLKEARIIQEIRRLSKLKGTYYEVEYDDDDRLRCSYNPVGASTGRLSSSQTVFKTGLDMQNLDPEFKTFIVPGRD